MARKNIMGAVTFFVLVVLTFFVIFKDNDMGQVFAAMQTLKSSYLAAAAATALLFTAAEGCMIWYLLNGLEDRAGFLSCLRYSFVGFFYSGITPSASGGQPMQLYYMQKEGHRVSDSTVVLMMVALIYKFVLVMMGIGILIFYYEPLKFYLKDYRYLYYLGLFLNGALVAALLFIMVSPTCFRRIVLGGEKILKKIHLLKASDSRTEKLMVMADQYHEAVLFLMGNKRKILCVTGFTFLQRCSVFFMTWLIYQGMGLQGQSVISIMVLQAVVYISVDMLPLPGAQGITELMYKAAYAEVFSGAYLTASMCVTRGFNFYFLMIVSAGAALWSHLRN